MSTAPPETASVPFLQAEGITKSFLGNRVLDGVDLTCEAGEVHALLGANGAGKSTLIQIFTGVYRPDGGTIRINGMPVRWHRPSDAEHAGIAAVYQELSLIDELDVAQNVMLGREPQRRWAVDRPTVYRRCRELSDRYQLDLDPTASVGSLSLARRQMVELAKVLYRDARLVIFDEPTATLSAAEQEKLFATLGDLRRQGAAIIYVSHRLEEIFKIADRVTVLRDGKLVLTTPMADISRNKIVEAMVGSRLASAPARATDAMPGDSDSAPALRVSELCSDKFSDVSLEVWRGEIVGLVGVVGSGRSSLLGSLFGINPISSGSVMVNGEQVALRSVRSAVNAGIALVTEDRKRTGLAINLAIHHNLNAVHLHSKLGLYRRRQARHMARHAAQLVSLERDVWHDVSLLSGGNQQKVALGKWLATAPRVLLCDEPTRGIDVGARADIYRVLRNLAEDGVGILLSTSDLEEVLSITSRILVLNRGRIVATFNTAEATEQALMRAATSAVLPVEQRHQAGGRPVNTRSASL